MTYAPLPEFWVRKMRSFFIIFDRDLDNIVNRKDYVDWVLERGNTYLSKEKVELFGPLLVKAWDEFWAGPEKKISVTIDEMVRSHARTFTDTHFSESLKNVLEVCFDGVDANNDGFVTLDEYTNFLACYGIHPLSVTPSFQAIDTNKDGVISREEFINAGKEFFQVTTDTPAKLFMGPFRA
ncbi:sarcoplasmic calcium-binding protein-like [Lingula anatina]|uniref:Sarcoplasmic calcium-binding protein-like n=1 Tax=Lingula anatina TaxID=7574 RepID=A0A1S3JE55_LINAN|nr:sarcoplasmic calcium-binding protein-like [Lingula anatina]|eukprot:XP_013408451.1 sarcoplasmic calcium-binding protein-like [Lingula anatina]